MKSSNIYIIFLTFGSYEDTVTKPLFSFAHKEEAEKHLERLKYKISRNIGLQSAVESIMVDWDIKNPNASCEDRKKENERLLALVEWDKDLSINWFDDNYTLYIQEIPFFNYADDTLCTRVDA